MKNNRVFRCPVTHNPWQKTVALLTFVFFTVTTVAWSAPAGENVPSVSSSVSSPLSALDLQKLAIPQELGKIERVFQGNSDQTVLLIQDAHCNYDAQTHIRQLIELFQKDYGLKLVAFEGGSGELDLLPLKAFPNAAVKQDVLDQYLIRGEVSGIELAAVLSPNESSFFAIEDNRIYQENRRAYLAAQAETESFRDDYDGLLLTLNRVRDILWADELKELDRRDLEQRAESAYLLDFVRFLYEKSKQYGLDLQSYPMLSGLIHRVELDEALDKGTSELFQTANDFIQEAKGRLSLLLEGKEKNDFGGKLQDYQVGQMAKHEFLTYLFELLERHQLALTGQEELKRVFGPSSELAAGQAPEFFIQLEALTQAVKEKLFRNEKERTLDKLYKHLSLLRELSRQSLSREDLKYYEAHRSEMTPEFFEDFLKEFGESSPRFGFAASEDFYKYALKRDQVLFDNLLALMKNRKARLAVAVAGGFHTEGLRRELEAEGLSYAVITPKIEDLGDPGTYGRVMRGELSYLDPERAKKDVQEEIEVSDPKVVIENLRSWRNGIINEALKRGKVAMSGEYTRYVDALFEALAKETSKSTLAPPAASLGEAREPFLEAFTADLLAQSLKLNLSLKKAVSGNWTPKDLSDYLRTRFTELIGEKTLQSLAEKGEKDTSARLEKLQTDLEKELDFLEQNYGQLKELFDKGALGPEEFKKLFFNENGERKIFARLLSLPERSAQIPLNEKLVAALDQESLDHLTQARVDTAEELLGLKNREALERIRQFFDQENIPLEQRLVYLEQAIQRKSGKTEPLARLPVTRTETVAATAEVSGQGKTDQEMEQAVAFLRDRLLEELINSVPTEETAAYQGFRDLYGRRFGTYIALSVLLTGISAAVLFFMGQLALIWIPMLIVASLLGVMEWFMRTANVRFLPELKKDERLREELLAPQGWIKDFKTKLAEFEIFAADRDFTLGELEERHLELAAELAGFEVQRGETLVLIPTKDHSPQGAAYAGISDEIFEAMTGQGPHWVTDAQKKIAVPREAVQGYIRLLKEVFPGVSGEVAAEVEISSAPSVREQIRDVYVEGFRDLLFVHVLNSTRLDRELSSIHPVTQRKIQFVLSVFNDKGIFEQLRDLLGAFYLPVLLLAALGYGKFLMSQMGGITLWSALTFFGTFLVIRIFRAIAQGMDFRAQDRRLKEVRQESPELEALVFASQPWMERVRQAVNREKSYYSSPFQVTAQVRFSQMQLAQERIFSSLEEASSGDEKSKAFGQAYREVLEVIFGRFFAEDQDSFEVGKRHEAMTEKMGMLDIFKTRNPGYFEAFNTVIDPERIGNYFELIERVLPGMRTTAASIGAEEQNQFSVESEGQKYKFRFYTDNTLRVQLIKEDQGKTEYFTLTFDPLNNLSIATAEETANLPPVRLADSSLTQGWKHWREYFSLAPVREKYARSLSNFETAVFDALKQEGLSRKEQSTLWSLAEVIMTALEKNADAQGTSLNSDLSLYRSEIDRKKKIETYRDDFLQELLKTTGISGLQTSRLFFSIKNLRFLLLGGMAFVWGSMALHVLTVSLLQLPALIALGLLGVAVEWFYRIMRRQILDDLKTDGTGRMDELMAPKEKMGELAEAFRDLSVEAAAQDGLYLRELQELNQAILEKALDEIPSKGSSDYDYAVAVIRAGQRIFEDTIVSRYGNPLAERNRDVKVSPLTVRNYAELVLETFELEKDFGAAASSLGNEIPAEVREALAAYDIGAVREAVVLDADKPHVLRVTTDTGTFLLKKPEYRNSSQKVDWEASLLQKLSEQGVEVAGVIANKNGANSTLVSEDLFVLYRFLESDRKMGWGEAEGTVLTQMGAELAKIHEIGQNADIAGEAYSREELPQVIALDQAERGMKRLEELYTQINRRGPPASETEQYFLDHYQELLSHIQKVRETFTPAVYDQLPKTIVHGDYHQNNMALLRSGKIGIFDLEFAHEDARVADLANALSIRFREGSDETLDLEKVAAFLKGYLAQTKTPLTEQEWKLLPDVFRLWYLEVISLFMEKLAEKPETLSAFKEQFANLRVLDGLDWAGLLESTGSSMGKETREQPSGKGDFGLNRRTFLQTGFYGAVATLLAPGHGILKAQEARPEFNDADTRILNSTEDAFLNGIFNITDERTRLPMDIAELDIRGAIRVRVNARTRNPDLKTSPSNVGFRLLSMIAYLEKIKGKRDARSRDIRQGLVRDVGRILRFLERAREDRGLYFRYYWLHPEQVDHNGVPRPDTNTEFSSVDNANLTAGMLAAAAFFKNYREEEQDYSDRLIRLVLRQDFSQFIDDGKVSHGYRFVEGRKQMINMHYDIFFTEARLLVFLANILNTDPAKRESWERIWDGLRLEPFSLEVGRENLRFAGKSWGGSIFEYTHASLVLDEQKHGARNISETLRNVIKVHKDDATNGFWGRSPAFGNRVAEGEYQYEDSGNRRLGYRGYPSTHVTPYSWGLSAPFALRDVLDQIKRARDRMPNFLSDRAGARDSFDPERRTYPPLALSWDTDLAALGFNTALQRSRGEDKKTVSDFFWEGLDLLADSRLRDRRAMGERLLGKEGPNVFDGTAVRYERVAERVTVAPVRDAAPAQAFHYDTSENRGGFSVNVYREAFSIENQNYLEITVRTNPETPLPQKFVVELKKERGQLIRSYDVQTRNVGAQWTTLIVPLQKNLWEAADRTALIKEIGIAFRPGADNVGAKAERGAIQIEGVRFIPRPMGKGQSLGAEAAVPAKSDLAHAEGFKGFFSRLNPFRKTEKKSEDTFQPVSAAGSVIAGMVSLGTTLAMGVGAAAAAGSGIGLGLVLGGLGVYGLAATFGFFYQALKVRGPDPVAQVVNNETLQVDQDRFSKLPRYMQYSILRHEEEHLNGRGEFMAYLKQALFLPVDFIKGMFARAPPQIPVSEKKLDVLDDIRYEDVPALLASPFAETVMVGGQSLGTEEVKRFLFHKFKDVVRKEIQGTSDVERVKKLIAYFAPSFFKQTMNWTIYETAQDFFKEIIRIHPGLNARKREILTSYTISVLNGSEESAYFADKYKAATMAQNFLWLKEAGMDFSKFEAVEDGGSRVISAELSGKVNWSVLGSGTVKEIEEELSKLSGGDVALIGKAISRFAAQNKEFNEKVREIILRERDSLVEAVKGADGKGDPSKLTDEVRLKAISLVAMAFASRTGEENKKAQQEIIDDQIRVFEAQLQRMEEQGEPKKGEKERVKKMVESLKQDREKVFGVPGNYFNAVQLLTGEHISQGGIAELGTGEGKTITSTIGHFIHSLVGRATFQLLTTDGFAVNDLRKTKDVYDILGVETRLFTKELKDEMTQQPDALKGIFKDEFVKGKHGAVVYTGVATLAFTIGEDRDNIRKSGREGRTVPEKLYYANIDEIDSITFDQALVEFIIAEMGEELTAGEQTKFKFAERIANVLKNYGISESYRLLSAQSEEVKALVETLQAKQVEYRAQESGRPQAAAIKKEVRDLEGQIRNLRDAGEKSDKIKPIEDQLAAKQAAYENERKAAPDLTRLVDEIDQLRMEIDAKRLAEMQSQGVNANPFYIADYESRGLNLSGQGKELLEGIFKTYEGTLKETGLLDYEQFEELVLKGMRAHVLYLENVDYVVDEATSEIKLVDKYTGEITDRRDEDVGVLLDTKHSGKGVKILGENKTSSKISGRDVILHFETMSGFSGSVFSKEAMREFQQGFGKKPEQIKKITTNVKTLRKLLDDTMGRKILKNNRGLYDWLGAEIQDSRDNRNRASSLVFVRSIKAAQEIRKNLIESGAVSEEDIMILGDAKDVDAAIRFARQLGKVVISTPVAGRGTDWLLPEWSDAKKILEKLGIPSQKLGEIKGQLDLLERDREEESRAEKVKQIEALFEAIFQENGVDEKALRSRLAELEKQLIEAEKNLRDSREKGEGVTEAETAHKQAREALQNFKQEKSFQFLEAKDTAYAKYVNGLKDLYQVNQSERIDKQVYGRVARQSDPGVSRGFFVLEDGDKGDIAEILRPGLMRSGEKLTGAERKILESGRYVDFEKTSREYKALYARLEKEGKTSAEIEADAGIQKLEALINGFITEAQAELDRIDTQTRLIANGFNSVEWRTALERDDWYFGLRKGLLEGKYDMKPYFSRAIELIFEQYEKTGDGVTLAKTLGKLGFTGLNIPKGQANKKETARLKKAVLAKVSEIKMMASSEQAYVEFVDKIIKQMEMDFLERQKNVRSLYQSGSQDEKSKKKNWGWRLLYGARDFFKSAKETVSKGVKKVLGWTGMPTLAAWGLYAAGTALLSWFGAPLIPLLIAPVAALLIVNMFANDWIGGVIDKFNSTGFSFRLPFLNGLKERTRFMGIEIGPGYVNIGGFLGRTEKEITAQVSAFDRALQGEMKSFTTDLTENVASALFYALGGDKLYTEPQTDKQIDTLAQTVVKKVTDKLGEPGVEKKPARMVDVAAQKMADFFSWKNIAAGLESVAGKIGLGEFGWTKSFIGFVRGKEKVERIYQEMGRVWSSGKPLTPAVARPVSAPEPRTVTQETVKPIAKGKTDELPFIGKISLGEEGNLEVTPPAAKEELGAKVPAYRVEKTGTPSDGKQTLSVATSSDSGLFVEANVALPEGEVDPFISEPGRGNELFEESVAASLGEMQEITVKREKDGKTVQITVSVPRKLAGLLLQNPEKLDSLLERRFSVVNIAGQEYLFGRTPSGKLIYAGGEGGDDDQLRAVFKVLASPYFGNPAKLNELHDELQRRLEGVRESGDRDKVQDQFEKEYPDFVSFLKNPFRDKIELHGVSLTESGALVIGGVKGLAENKEVTLERGAIVIDSYLKKGVVRRGAVLEGVSAPEVRIEKGARLRGVQSAVSIQAGARAIIEDVKDDAKKGINVGDDQYLAGRYTLDQYVLKSGEAKDFKLILFPKTLVRMFRGLLNWLYREEDEDNLNFIWKWVAGMKGSFLQPFVNRRIGYSPKDETYREKMFLENLSREGMRKMWLLEYFQERLNSKYRVNGPFLAGTDQLDGPITQKGKVTLNAQDLDFLTSFGPLKQAPQTVSELIQMIAPFVLPEEAGAFLSRLEALAAAAQPGQTADLVLGLRKNDFYRVSIKGEDVPELLKQLKTLLKENNRPFEPREAPEKDEASERLASDLGQLSSRVEQMTQQKKDLDQQIADLDGKISAEGDAKTKETLNTQKGQLEQTRAKVQEELDLFQLLRTEEGQTRFAERINDLLAKVKEDEKGLSPEALAQLREMKRWESELYSRISGGGDPQEVFIKLQELRGGLPPEAAAFLALREELSTLEKQLGLFQKKDGKIVSAALENALFLLKLSESSRKTEEFGRDLTAGKSVNDQIDFFTAALNEKSADGNPSGDRQKISERLKKGGSVSFSGVTPAEQLDPRLREAFESVGLPSVPMVVIEVDKETHKQIASNLGQPPSVALNVNLSSGVRVLLLQKDYVPKRGTTLLPEKLYEKIYQIIHEAVHSTQVLKRSYRVDDIILNDFEAYLLQMLAGGQSPQETYGNARWVNATKDFYAKDASKVYILMRDYAELRRKIDAGRATEEEKAGLARLAGETEKIISVRTPEFLGTRKLDAIPAVELEQLISRIQQEDEALINQAFETVIYLTQHLSVKETFGLIRKAKTLKELTALMAKSPEELQGQKKPEAQSIGEEKKIVVIPPTEADRPRFLEMVRARYPQDKFPDLKIFELEAADTNALHSPENQRKFYNAFDERGDVTVLGPDGRYHSFFMSHFRKDPGLIKRMTQRLTSSNIGTKILSVGEGAGDVVGPLTNQGFDAHGIDISDRNVAEANQKGIKTVYVGDAFKIDPSLPNYGQYDQVIYPMSVGGFDPERLEETFREAYKALRPGGRIIVLSYYNPNEKEPSSLLASLYHIHPAQKIQEAMERAGFENGKVGTPFIPRTGEELSFIRARKPREQAEVSASAASPAGASLGTQLPSEQDIFSVISPADIEKAAQSYLEPRKGVRRPKDNNGNPGGLEIVKGAKAVLDISDLHGRYDHLKAILEKENALERLAKGDLHIVFTGDMIHPEGDFSPEAYLNSFKPFLLFVYLRNQFPAQVHFVPGNHDFAQLPEADLQVIKFLSHADHVAFNHYVATGDRKVIDEHLEKQYPALIQAGREAAAKQGLGDITPLEIFDQRIAFHLYLIDRHPDGPDRGAEYVMAFHKFLENVPAMATVKGPQGDSPRIGFVHASTAVIVSAKDIVSAYEDGFDAARSGKLLTSLLNRRSYDDIAIEGFREKLGVAWLFSGHSGPGTVLSKNPDAYLVGNVATVLQGGQAVITSQGERRDPDYDIPGYAMIDLTQPLPSTPADLAAAVIRTVEPPTAVSLGQDTSGRKRAEEIKNILAGLRILELKASKLAADMADTWKRFQSIQKQEEDLDAKLGAKGESKEFVATELASFEDEKIGIGFKVMRREEVLDRVLRGMEKLLFRLEPYAFEDQGFENSRLKLPGKFLESYRVYGDARREIQRIREEMKKNHLDPGFRQIPILEKERTFSVKVVSGLLGLKVLDPASPDLLAGLDNAADVEALEKEKALLTKLVNRELKGKKIFPLRDFYRTLEDEVEDFFIDQATGLFTKDTLDRFASFVESYLSFVRRDQASPAGSPKVMEIRKINAQDPSDVKALEGKVVRQKDGDWKYLFVQDAEKPGQKPVMSFLSISFDPQRGTVLQKEEQTVDAMLGKEFEVAEIDQALGAKQVTLVPMSPEMLLLDKTNRDFSELKTLAVTLRDDWQQTRRLAEKLKQLLSLEGDLENFYAAVKDIQKVMTAETGQEKETLYPKVRNSLAFRLGFPAVDGRFEKLDEKFPDETVVKVLALFAPEASSLGEKSFEERKVNFERYILSLVNEKYSMGLNVEPYNAKDALDFLFGLKEEEKAPVFSGLKDSLERQFRAYAEQAGQRGALPDFSLLARRILFEGLDSAKLTGILRDYAQQAGVDGGEEKLAQFVKAIEKTVGGAALNAAASGRSAEENKGNEVLRVLSDLRATPEEFNEAFGRVARKMGLPVNLFEMESAQAPSESLAAAMHVDSLPLDFDGKLVRALLKAVGEKGKLFLVFERGSEGAKKAEKFLGFLTPEDKQKVVRMTYVAGMEPPVADAARQMGKMGSEIGRAFILPDMKAVQQQLEKINNMQEAWWFEVFSKEYPASFTTALLSMAFSSALLKQLPDTAEKSALGGASGFLVTFDVVKLAEMLGQEIEAIRAVEIAA